MKNYKGFYREAKGNLPHIYCDMDGVLTDFVLAAKKATGQDWEGMRHGQDWNSIKDTPNFWSNMPWMKDGKRLWGYINKYNPSILSAAVKEQPRPKLQTWEVKMDKWKLETKQFCKN